MASESSNETGYDGTMVDAQGKDAARHAIQQAKLNALRNALDAAEAEGGSFATDEVRRHAREHLDGLRQTPKGS
jgi:hypothetical protein